MIIESLELKNFRNYGALTLEFDPGSNLLYGDNAQGKTNILEALYICAAAKSHRSGKDREMIRFGEDEAHIRLMLKKKDVPYRIDMHLKRDRSKGIAVNGVPIRRASELFGTLNAVLFSPEDLNIIKNGPSDRRRFMDMELCQLDRSYVFSLVNYNRALLQRNRLLKDLWSKPQLEETLSVWDEQIIRYGRELILRREAFLKDLNPVIREIHEKLTGGKETLFLSYDGNVRADAFPEALFRSRDQDLRQKMTLVGPHRDDIGFFVGKTGEMKPDGGGKGSPGMDLRRYGSQGQQRTAALSLKLSELQIMRSLLNESPVLLLDDVLSELDTDRQKHLVGAISDIQTVITSTGMDNLLEKEFRIDRKYEVIDGTVRKAD